MKVFAEEAYSVALHPTGLSMLVGFADKLRLMVVLMDELRWAGELGCTPAFKDSSALLHGHMPSFYQSAPWMHQVVACMLTEMQCPSLCTLFAPCLHILRG